MTFINIVFIAIASKMVGYLTNIYCPMVGHLIENLLKKPNAPHMPVPPPLELNQGHRRTGKWWGQNLEKGTLTLITDFHAELSH